MKFPIFLSASAIAAGLAVSGSATANSSYGATSYATPTAPLATGYAPRGPMCKGPRRGPAGYGPWGYRPMPPMMRGPYMPPYANRPAMPGYQQPMPGGVQQQVMEPTEAAQSAEPVGEGAVRIAGMQFDPPRIVVEKGATVTWTQSEQMPHTVTASDGSFTSETLGNGQTFSMTFDEAGTVKYYCSLHPGMRGEVVVVE